MLLDSNILIYGGKAEHPRLDEILARTDLAAASITCIETLDTTSSPLLSDIGLSRRSSE